MGYSLYYRPNCLTRCQGIGATLPDGRMKGCNVDIREKFATTRRELSAALIERDDEINLCLTAIIAQGHVLLVGQPGTAKSLLCDSLVQWIGGKQFSILLTKFSTPEEVFGPISLAGLKADEYRRITTGYIPEAEVAFVDEVWKASSAILNTLLKILNERTFVNGAQSLQCPLRLCVSASNEWPSNEGGKELSAMFDRFLFRKHVKPITTETGRERLLWGGNHSPQLTTTATVAELDKAASEAAALPWTDDAKDALRSIIHEARREGIAPGDRRQFKAIGAARAYAWLSGSDEVLPDHLEVLAHVLWDDPQEQPMKLADIIGRIANPIGMKVNALLAEADEVIANTALTDMGQCIGASKKLCEVLKQLKALNGDPRATKARDYVSGEIKRIKLACVDSLS